MKFSPVVLLLLIICPLACVTAQTVSYDVNVAQALTPYVNGNQGAFNRAVFRPSDNLRSIADFTIKNNNRDSIYVLLKAEMHAVGGAVAENPVAELEMDPRIVEIESGNTMRFEDVGVEYDTPTPSADRYVVTMTYRISLDPDLEDVIDDIGQGGWANEFRRRDEK